MSHPDTSFVQGGARYWNGIAEAWLEQGRDPVWRAHSDAVNAALLARWLPRRELRHFLKTDLFDEASAEGLYPMLQQRAQRVTGIDISTKVVAAACTRYPLLEGVVADVLRLPFEDEEFDAVVSLSTLDHFDSPDDIRVGLLELYRVLTPRGILVITLDNDSNPVIALRNRLPYELLHRVGLVPYRMGATCTLRRLTALLRSCSFDLHDVACIVHCPRALAVLAARLVERAASDDRRARFLRMLAICERLEWWPTRMLTGYFVGALAVKR